MEIPWGPIHKEQFPLENLLENLLENWLEIFYTGKSPKIGSLGMSENQNLVSGGFSGGFLSGFSPWIRPLYSRLFGQIHSGT